MDLQDYLRVLRKRWRLILVCVLVAVAGAAAVTYVIKPSYSATAQLFVSTRNSAGDIAGVYQGQLFSQAGVTSYADIIDSPSVLDPVIASLHLDTTANQLSKQVSATSPLNTVLIDVSVNDRYPATAQAIANRVATQFARVIEQLETPVSGGPSPVKVTVVQPATRPTAPASPRKKLNLGLGLLVGVAIGVGGAVLRESLDRSVKDPEEMQAITGAPTLGVIGYDPEFAKHPLMVISKPNAPVSEAFRQLRTNLQFLNVDAAKKALVFTSSIPLEGKTTTVCNLAVAVAQTGATCLLIEGDLRRPKAAEYMGLDSSIGLSTVLTGKLSVQEAAQRWGSDGLYFLASGALPPNPSELLGSRNMRALLAEAEQAFDLVVIDAPPLLPVTDAAVIAGFADGAILVTHTGSTHRDQVARATEALRTVDVKLLGTVLTMVATKGPDAYRYGYGYGSATQSATHQPGPRRADSVVDNRRGGGPGGPPFSEERALKETQVINWSGK
jgi:capsular exopolysaccharide synthesis family protein